MENNITVFPAIFTFDGKNYNVNFIDLNGCSTFGKSVLNAYAMAQEAMGLFLEELTTFPLPTLDFSGIKLEKNQFISFVSIDMDEYRKKHNNKAVKKTLTIPLWLNNLCEKNNINFSQVLQEALKQKLGLI